MADGVSIVLPAHDEAAYIDACLAALLATRPPPVPVEVIVVANGCRDDTALRSSAQAGAFADKGWTLRVLDLPESGKAGALTAGDRAARHGTRVYLDADTLVAPELLGQIVEHLDRDTPAYASGSPLIAEGKSAATRAYAAFWQQLPFFRTGVPGFGIFAVNRAGRSRWADWPDIISDDTFARLQFRPDERHRVAGHYHWPLVEGMGALIRVRRRQNAGVAEITARFPELVANDDRRRMTTSALIRAAVRAPLGFTTYLAVSLAVKVSPGRRHGWDRGR